MSRCRFESENELTAETQLQHSLFGRNQQNKASGLQRSNFSLCSDASDESIPVRQGESQSHVYHQHLRVDDPAVTQTDTKDKKTSYKKAAIETEETCCIGLRFILLPWLKRRRQTVHQTTATSEKDWKCLKDPNKTRCHQNCLYFQTINMLK